MLEITGPTFHQLQEALSDKVEEASSDHYLSMNSVNDSYTEIAYKGTAANLIMTMRKSFTWGVL